MDEARRNEIAYKILMLARLKGDAHGENGVRLDDGFRRQVGNIAKQIGVPFAELLEFEVAFARTMLEKVSDAKRPPTEDELKGYRGH
jgi:hypothetical protein